MRNIKVEQNLIGLEHWTKIPMLEVPADAKASTLPADLSEANKEAIIQSWKTVAVLRVLPENVPFRFGFLADKHMEILRQPVEPVNNQFGVRVGAKPVKFFVISEDDSIFLALELIEITVEDSPRYPELPLY